MDVSPKIILSEAQHRLAGKCIPGNFHNNISPFKMQSKMRPKKKNKFCSLICRRKICLIVTEQNRGPSFE